MSTPAIDRLGSLTPAAQVTEKRLGRFAFFLAVAWMVAWHSDVVGFIERYLPVSSYYVLVAPYIVYLVAMRPVECMRLASRPLFWFWFATAFIPALMYITSTAITPEAYASMRGRIVFFSAVAGTAVLLSSGDSRRIVRTSALIVLFVAVSINFAELLVGGIFSVSTEGRAAGLYLNPNKAGAAIIVALLFCVDLARQTRGSLLLLTAGFAGVMATFSRSGMIFGAALWLYHAFLSRSAGRGENSAGRILLVLGLLVVFVVGSFAVSRVVDLHPDAAGRVTQTLQLRADDKSALSRLDKLKYSWTAFLQNPWTGAGLGTPEYFALSPHNTYLYVGNEFGILGILFFVTPPIAALLRALRVGWRRGASSIALVGYILYSGMFTHSVHNHAAFAVAFGVLMVDGLIYRAPPRPDPE